MSKIHFFCIRFFVVSLLFLTSFFFVPKANAEFSIRPITVDEIVSNFNRFAERILNTDYDGDGYTRAEGDCKDSNPDINPGMEEVCDGIDNNCSGVADEGVTITFYHDADGDTFGLSTATTEACEAPDGYATRTGDCNDSNAAVNPDAAEVCDGIDNNCSGSIDELFDTDGDGFTSCAGDCNDSNAAIHPSASEFCDGADNNCNGSIDEGVTTTFYRDADGDGHGLASATIAACSLPVGYAYTAGDCNDGNAAINPSASEFCDGIDNNCNDEIDEGVLTTFYLDADGDDFGVATTTTEACTRPTGYATRIGDCNDGVATINPGATEVCNATDDNCNGSADEGLPLSTYIADADGDGYGNPDDTVRNCALPSDTYILASASLGDDCDDVHASANPGVTYQALGDIDTDCDGSLDLSIDDAMVYEFGSSPTANVYPSVSCADIDGDGVKNLVISDPTYRNSVSGASGNLYILENGGSYFNPGTTNRLDPTSTEVMTTYSGPVYFSQLGSSMATYDMNGDGTDDLIIGSKGHNNPLSGGDGSLSGGIYFLYGSDGFESGHFDLSSSEYDVDGGVLPTNMAFLKGLDELGVGQNIHVAGDIDGDGIIDLVDTNSTHVRVYVFPLQPNPASYYSSGSYELDRLIEIVSYTTYSSFSQDHVALGDINDDGLIDMVINNPTHQELYSCLGCQEGQRQIVFGGGALGSYWKAPDEEPFGEPLIDLNDMAGTGLNFLAYHEGGIGSQFGQDPVLTDLDGDDYLDLIDGSPSFDIPGGERGLSIASYGHSLVDDFAEFGSSYLDFDLSNQSASGASCILSRLDNSSVPQNTVAGDFNGDGTNDIGLLSNSYADTGDAHMFVIKNEKFLEIRGGEAYIEDDGVVANRLRIVEGIGFGSSDFQACQIDGVGGQELVGFNNRKVFIFRGQPE